MTEKLTLTIEECCKLLGISRSLGYDLARKGELPGVLKLGGRFVISKFKLNQWLNGNGIKEEVADG